MKLKTDKKPLLSILTVLAIGLVLAAAILLWKKEAPAVQNDSEHADEIAGNTPTGEAAHAGDMPGTVEMTAQQAQSAGIIMANANAATIETVLILPGEVRTNEDRTAHIVPRVAGVVESVSASLGQEVKKGQQLAVIASAGLAEMRSAALAADQRLALARLTYEREKKLWADKISAEQDYLQAQQAFHEAQIESRSARAGLAALGAGAEYGAINRYVLRAPLDGVIVEKHLVQGEAVKEDASVFLVSDLSTVWVELTVTARDLEDVRVGQAVAVKSANGTATVTGTVSYVGSLLGEQTRAATARVVIGNPDLAWRPGLFVNVALVRGRKEAAVTVRSEAVQTIDGKAIVFAQVAGGFQARQVSTGVSDGVVTEILEGLAAGTQYAATGSFVMKAELAKGSAGHGH